MVALCRGNDLYSIAVVMIIYVKSGRIKSAELEVSDLKKLRRYRYVNRL